jgi:hypothetical protein
MLNLLLDLGLQVRNAEASIKRKSILSILSIKRGNWFYWADR